MTSRGVVVSGLAGDALFSGELELSLTVKRVKERLEEETAWPAKGQRLLWNGKDMAPAGATLESLVGDNAEDPLRIILVKCFNEEVYFFGLSWGTSNCGISAKHCIGAGDALNNSNTQDRFKKIKVAEGVCFESVTHPGLYIGTQDGSLEEQKVVLVEPDGRREIFQVVPAINQDEAKVSLESVAFPGRLVCHYYGTLYCHSREHKLAGDTFYANDASWHIAEVDE
jgi:hypothetical protein